MKPWIVWIDGVYGPSVTNNRSETIEDAVRWCAVYTFEHGGGPEPKTWCACLDEEEGEAYEKMEHPPRSFSRFFVSANGQEVVEYERVVRVGDNTDAYGR